MIINTKEKFFKNIGCLYSWLNASKCKKNMKCVGENCKYYFASIRLENQIWETSPEYCELPD